MGVELVDIAGGLASIAALAAFCRVWQPRDTWESAEVAAPVSADARSAFAAASGTASVAGASARQAHATQSVARAWMPWMFLSVAVIVWGLPGVKATLNEGALAPTFDVPLLHRAVFRDFPVVPAPVDLARISDPAYRNEVAEPARFVVNWASATGTAILLAALASAL